MSTNCPVCDRLVDTGTRGRPAVYCSQACRAKAYRARVATTGHTAPKTGSAATRARRSAAALGRAGRQLAAAVASGVPDHAAEAQARDLLGQLTVLAYERDETPAAVVTKNVDLPQPPADDEPAPTADTSSREQQPKKRPASARTDDGPLEWVSDLPRIRDDSAYEVVKTSQPGVYRVLVDGNLVGYLRRVSEKLGGRPVWGAVDAVHGLPVHYNSTGATPEHHARTRDQAAVGLLSELLFRQEKQQPRRSRHAKLQQP